MPRISRSNSVSGTMLSVAKAASAATERPAESAPLSGTNSPAIQRQNTRRFSFSANQRIHGFAAQLANRRNSFNDDIPEPPSPVARRHSLVEATQNNLSQINPSLSRAFSTYFSQKAPFRGLALQYEGVGGRLKNYEKAIVGSVSSSLSWAHEHDLLPAEAHNVLDLGAAQGGAVLYMAQRYPTAHILALDTDPRSAKFIHEKIISRKEQEGPTAIANPGRINTFTGTLSGAFANDKCQENTLDLINMDAVSPYMDDDQLSDLLEQVNLMLAVGGKVCITGYGEKHGFEKKIANNDSISKRTDLQMVSLLRQADFQVNAVSNKLYRKDGTSLEKTVTDMDDFGKGGRDALPEGVKEGENYWHSVKLVATKMAATT